MTEAGRQVVAFLLDAISGGWWTVCPDRDARVIDRGIARFLAEIEEPACVRCGEEPYAQSRYCDACRQSVQRQRRKSRKSSVTA